MINKIRYWLPPRLTVYEANCLVFMHRLLKYSEEDKFRILKGRGRILWSGVQPEAGSMGKASGMQLEAKSRRKEGLGGTPEVELF